MESKDHTPDEQPIREIVYRAPDVVSSGSLELDKQLREMRNEALRRTNATIELLIKLGHEVSLRDALDIDQMNLRYILERAKR